MSDQATAAVRVRVIGLYDHFVFDTDHQLLVYEVCYPDGRTVEKKVLWYRDHKAPVELDLS